MSLEGNAASISFTVDFRKGPMTDLSTSLTKLTTYRIKYELDIAFYFGNIVLYRPFLHYLAKAREDVNTDERQLRCALACVKVATNVISSSKVALHRGYLYPPSWCSVYTIFLSVVCLVFFIATHTDSPASAEVRLDIEAGIGILARVTCHDTGAERCLDILQVCLARRPVSTRPLRSNSEHRSLLDISPMLSHWM